jgi:catechol 2,3-dioxygenase-like lactoylglutathione lyase family enzyme
MELERIDHVALAVGDVERSARWYIGVLGFERRYDEIWGGYPVFVGKGKAAIALFPARAGGRQGPERNSNGPISSSRPPIRMLHLAFRANRKNFLAAQEELKRRGIKFEFQDHEISHSIYFQDPDGHELEITTYEL